VKIDIKKYSLVKNNVTAESLSSEDKNSLKIVRQRPIIIIIIVII